MAAQVAAQKGGDSDSSSDSSVHIIDSFAYNGELVIELRLRHLWPVVDEFVVTEARETHSGKPKAELFIDRYRSSFQPYLSKARQHLCGQLRNCLLAPVVSPAYSTLQRVPCCQSDWCTLLNRLRLTWRIHSYTSWQSIMPCPQPGDDNLSELQYTQPEWSYACAPAQVTFLVIEKFPDPDPAYLERKGKVAWMADTEAWCAPQRLPPWCLRQVSST